MPRYSFLAFVHRQWRTIPPVRTADLTGKTVVVIGANAGIGFEAAKHFATMNAAKLVLGCRSRERGELAISKLQNETGYTRAELWLIDLAEFQSVKAFVDKFEKEGGRLDYLVLNAGVAMTSTTYTATADGYETTIQVNCLAPSLLALLLLPIMVETAKNHLITPRIVVVSSEVHGWASFSDQVLSSHSPLQVLGSNEYCTKEVMGRRYPDSKLLNILFVRALSDRLKSHFIVNAVNPGFCVSELRRNATGRAVIIFKVMELFLAWTAEQGSRNLVYAALSGSDGNEEDHNLHGAYISNCEIDEPSEFVLSDQGKEVQEKLWKDTLDILSKVDLRVPTIAEKYLS
ncbi:hypothetical protein M378DRAFT_186611 [Amanita muscaria Koide BX008]|uniref:Uncharacterized protein n=1 Tax=Amanita muscaria (strain Koide BX008) TaxID=946122 RepID=A0A0C2X6A1_AMAMK|nr:hypothetical protein M378DRAFT_186611 [Amanita muscaria Koide BX008]